LHSELRKISSVGSLTGGTKWYLSDDCLLAAKRVMYVVEYRRFYLHDLESIVVWPSRLWLWRVTIPALLLLILGASLWQWVNSTAGGIFIGMGLAWVGLELLLGPTARARIRTTGVSLDLRLVNRTRRARKVLAKIDSALRVTRSVNEQPDVPANVIQSSEPPAQTNSEVASATATRTETTQTNGS
jgi:hypothetical protein